jgi:CheY-like chemotaxis protein
VLIVEDYPDAADSLAILLRLWGHDVHIARTGPLALEAAPKFRPDLALIDLMLPGMDGYRVARSMRDHEELRDTMLIAVTGFADKSHRELGQDAGFTRYLIKPLDLDELQGILTTLAAEKTCATLAKTASTDGSTKKTAPPMVPSPR